MRPLNVLVCGTCFGEHYIAALASMPHKYRLYGLLGRGSERTKALATHLNVPLFTNPKDIPNGEVDIACVVVRSTLFGGIGTDLAQALLQKKIHVLQEHPVHSGEIKALHQTAQTHGVRYHVNGFYPHIPAGATFIRYVTQARQQTPPSFVEMTTSRQFLYSTLDILGRALGGFKDLTVHSPNMPFDKQLPFHVLQGYIGLVPFTLSLQSYMDTVDMDHHSLVMHRMAIGGPAGVVNLVNTFGPVVWTGSIYVPNYHVDDTLKSSFILNPESASSCPYRTQPSFVTFGNNPADSLGNSMKEQCHHAIGGALDELAAAINDPIPPYFASESYISALSNAWVTLLRTAGPPDMRTLPPPPLPHPIPLDYAKDCTSDHALCA